MVRQASKKRTFSCQKCGEPYDAYPPDDLHDTASLKEPSKADAWDFIKVEHDCYNCGTQITVYWYQRRMHISVG